LVFKGLTDDRSNPHIHLVSNRIDSLFDIL